MNPQNRPESNVQEVPMSTNGVVGPWGVRYQVKDVARSIDFYTQRLGFKLDAKHLPAFGQVSLGL